LVTWLSENIYLNSPHSPTKDKLSNTPLTKTRTTLRFQENMRLCAKNDQISLLVQLITPNKDLTPVEKYALNVLIFGISPLKFLTLVAPMPNTPLLLRPKNEKFKKKLLILHFSI